MQEGAQASAVGRSSRRVREEAVESFAHLALIQVPNEHYARGTSPLLRCHHHAPNKVALAAAAAAGCKLTTGLQSSLCIHIVCDLFGRRYRAPSSLPLSLQ